MKVVRSFHPVGQGAFYSERFSKHNPDSEVNLVYDCGSSRGSIIKAESVVAQAFDKSDDIDYLFISHLDYDHISLIETLFSSVNNVRNIVLPLIDKEELVIANALFTIMKRRDAERFTSRLIKHLKIQDNDIEDYYRGDYNLIFVGNSPERDVSISNSRYIQSGVPLQNTCCSNWEFIPYNIKNEERKRELINEFNNLFSNVGFCQELQKVKSHLTGGEDLYKQLSDTFFVKTVLQSSILRKNIKTAYEKIEGGINENSLILYSGPKNKDSFFRLTITYPFFNYYHNRYKAGCIYTGDSKCELNVWRSSVFASVWDNIGTIQLPHHGSIKSFDFSQNIIDKSYIFPVSCGITNTFGHPSGKVLSYLTANNCYCHIVTEWANTLFMQKIMIHFDDVQFYTP